MNDLLTPVESPVVSRRAIAKGIAWTAPAIAFAGALPAMAASPVLTLTYLGSCKYPGNSDGDPLCKQGYRLQTRWINYSSVTLRTTFRINLSVQGDQNIQYIFFNGVYYSYTGGTDFIITLDVPPGTYNIDAITDAGNSANISGDVTGTAHYCYQNAPYDFALKHHFDATPPNCEMACPGAINSVPPPTLSAPAC